MHSTQVLDSLDAQSFFFMLNGRPFAMSKFFNIIKRFYSLKLKKIEIHFARLIFTLNSHVPQQNVGHSFILGFLLFFLLGMVSMALEV